MIKTKSNEFFVYFCLYENLQIFSLKDLTKISKMIIIKIFKNVLDKIEEIY